MNFIETLLYELKKCLQLGAFLGLEEVGKVNCSN